MSLLWFMLVWRVEKSKVETEYAFFLKLYLLNAPISSCLFKTLRKVSIPNKKYIYHFNSLKNKLKIDVKTLGKCLTESFGAAITNRGLIGCL